MKNNRTLTILLMGLASAIWGSIAFQLYTSIAASGIENDGPSDTFAGGVRSSAFIYSREVRDPFSYSVRAKNDTSRRFAQSHGVPPWIPPPMKLTGVVLAGKIRTAMLETVDGAIVFAHEGDTLRGVKLLKISDQTVSYVYQQKKSGWTLQK